MAREGVSASRWEEGNRSDQNNRRARVSTHPTGRKRWSIIGENVCFFVYEPIPRWGIDEWTVPAAHLRRSARVRYYTPTKPSCGRHGGVYKGRWSTTTSTGREEVRGSGKM